MDYRDALAWSQTDRAVPRTSSEIMTWLDATVGSAGATGELVAVGMYRSAKNSEMRSSFLLNRIFFPSSHVRSCPNPSLFSPGPFSFIFPSSWTCLESLFVFLFALLSMMLLDLA